VQLRNSGEAVTLLSPSDCNVHPLSGQGTFHEYDLAARTADAVPGVVEIIDELVAELPLTCHVGRL